MQVKKALTTIRLHDIISTMGKLQKIRRAFSALPHERKIKMYQRQDGYNFKKSLSQNVTWGFDYYCNSYRKFVAKLVNEYYDKHVNQQKHVVERAYFNKEPWAIAQVEKKFC